MQQHNVNSRHRRKNPKAPKMKWTKEEEWALRYYVHVCPGWSAIADNMNLQFPSRKNMNHQFPSIFAHDNVKDKWNSLKKQRTKQNPACAVTDGVRVMIKQDSQQDLERCRWGVISHLTGRDRDKVWSKKLQDEEGLLIYNHFNLQSLQRAEGAVQQSAPLGPEHPKIDRDYALLNDVELQKRMVNLCQKEIKLPDGSPAVRSIPSFSGPVQLQVHDQSKDGVALSFWFNDAFEHTLFEHRHNIDFAKCVQDHKTLIAEDIPSACDISLSPCGSTKEFEECAVVARFARILFDAAFKHACRGKADPPPLIERISKGWGADKEYLYFRSLVWSASGILPGGRRRTLCLKTWLWVSEGEYTGTPYARQPPSPKPTALNPNLNLHPPDCIPSTRGS